MNKLESEMIQAINRGVKMKKDNTKVIPTSKDSVIVKNYDAVIARIYFDAREIELVKAEHENKISKTTSSRYRALLKEYTDIEYAELKDEFSNNDEVIFEFSAEVES